MAKLKNGNELKPSVYKQVINLFETEHWSRISKNGEVDYFNRFCEMIEIYDENEQKLIIELSHNFIHIPPENYSNEILNLLRKLVKKKKSIKKLRIMPIINKEDLENGKVKSAHYVSYLFQNKEYELLEEFSNIKIHLVSNIRELGKKFNIVHDKMLVLVDDFIGSGETVVSCLDEIESTPLAQNEDGKDIFVENSKIVIMTIAITEKGLNVLIDKGYNVYYNHLIGRGIADFNSDTEIARKIEIMESIEKKIGICDEEKLGRKQSESLISLIRTPNNTFPAFWKKSKKHSPIYPRNN